MEEHVYHLFRRLHAMHTARDFYVGTYASFAEVVAAARADGGGRFDLATARWTEVAWSEIEEEERR